jgi:predicted GH43/DUF377 family glycosyl hydrolase
MKWQKKGIIYGPDGSLPWAKHSALQPTPILISEEVIRVYVGFRDEEGKGRIGFVDVSAANPSRVLRVSEKPVLDIGIPGAFDDSGVIPCAIVKREHSFFLYYAGYQLTSRVRFLAFSGLAVSDDGESFTRYKRTPTLERSDKELLFRAIHSIVLEDRVWKAWYGAGSEYVEGKDKALPSYDIRYIESQDGITFGAEGKVCIDIRRPDEYRVGRPYVIKHDGIYKMFYTIGTRAKSFRLGYAESVDGINWLRQDERIGLGVSDSGWDSEMICYPSVVQVEGTIYLFYNGNDYGRAGFGYAVLGEW